MQQQLQVMFKWEIQADRCVCLSHQDGPEAKFPGVQKLIADWNSRQNPA